MWKCEIQFFLLPSVHILQVKQKPKKIMNKKKQELIRIGLKKAHIVHPYYLVIFFSYFKQK